MASDDMEFIVNEEKGERYLFLLKPSDLSPLKDDKTMSLGMFVPSLFHLFIKGEKKNLKIVVSRFMFWLNSKGKMRIYFAFDLAENKLMHTSCLIPYCKKFGFMKKTDWEVGPCFTYSEYRGKGVYPYVLQYIVTAEYNENTDLYLIVRPTNYASIKGIEKAGGTICGAVKKNVLKRYTRI